MKNFKEYIIQGIGISIGFIITSFMCSIIIIIGILGKTIFVEIQDDYREYRHKIEKANIEKQKAKEEEKAKKEEEKIIRQQLEERKKIRKEQLPNFDSIDLNELNLNELNMSQDEINNMLDNGIKITDSGIYLIKTKSGVADVKVYDLIDKKYVVTIVSANPDKESTFEGEYGYIVIPQGDIEIKCSKKE